MISEAWESVCKTSMEVYMIKESLAEGIVKEMFDALQKESDFDEKTLQELKQLWEKRELANEDKLIEILGSECEEDL